MPSQARRAVLSFAAALCFFQIPPALATERASKDEAIAMVKRAITFYKANGKEKTFAEINAKNPQFFDRDLYVYVSNLQAVNQAHAANPKLVGKDLSQLKDADGRFFVEEILKLAKAGKSGWVDYRWPNPVTKEIEPKTTYTETFDGFIFSAGVYR